MQDKKKLLQDILYWLTMLAIFAGITAIGVFGWWLIEEITGYTAGLVALASQI